jgi:hypothetical protein
MTDPAFDPADIDDGLPEPEGPPPDTGLFRAAPPAPEGENTDAWGNLRIPPVKTIHEAHGENSITINIYQLDAAYYFGFQAVIAKFVRQKKANVKDAPAASIEAAKKSAVDMIVNLCKENHAIKRLFADFTQIQYNQPELFW